MPNCPVCKSLKRPKSGARLALEFSAKQLLESAADAKCQFCAAILQGILLMQDETWAFATDVSIISAYAFSNATLFLEIYFYQDKPRLEIEFFSDIAHPCDSEWQAVCPRESPTGYPLTKEGIKWIKGKFDDCWRKHICPTSQLSSLPDRLLSFSPSGEEVAVRIIEPKDEQGRYATLSYRWGPNQHFITTRTNLEDRKQGFQWTELPKTFQEAIQCCLELGISYLWIDALCILQDDPTDWQNQSAKMADIYDKSCITLAVTWSDSTTDGCFPEPGRAVTEHTFQIPSSAQIANKLKVRRRIPHWSATAGRLFTPDSPLLHRAWVFQERVLSPRVLHFCRHEMIWECGQIIACECKGLPDIPNLKTRFALAASPIVGDQGPGSEGSTTRPIVRPSTPRDRTSYMPEVSPDFDEFDEQLEAEKEKLRGLAKLVASESESKAEAIVAPVRQWHDIVKQYSEMELTKQTDRLPALSGLAARMAPFLGTYVVGLWKSCLLYDLAWEANQPYEQNMRHRAYRGPSWSWVSVDSSVRFLDLEDQVQLWSAHAQDLDLNTAPRRWNRTYMRPEFQSVQVTAKGENPYGEVSSATLLIRGVMQDARLCGSFDLDISLPVSSNNRIPSLPLRFRPDYKVDRHERKSELRLLALFPRICLVLLATNTKTDSVPTYKRIGIVELSPEIETMYQVDWLDGAQLCDIAIV